MMDFVCSSICECLVKKCNLDCNKEDKMNIRSMLLKRKTLIKKWKKAKTKIFAQNKQKS